MANLVRLLNAEQPHRPADHAREDRVEAVPDLVQAVPDEAVPDAEMQHGSEHAEATQPDSGLDPISDANRFAAHIVRGMAKIRTPTSN
jgi:hypothetical protein